MKDNAAPAPVKVGAVDIEAFAKNLARMVEEGGKALAAYMKPREEGQVAGRPLRRDQRHGQDASARSANIGCPIRAARSNCSRSSAAPISICGARRPSGSPAKRPGRSSRPIRRTTALPIRNGRRTSSSTSSSRPICSAPTGPTIWSKDAKDLDPHTRQKAEFYVRQVANALSPSNFVLTNPELLRETLSSNAENLARGMHMLAEDIEAGGGDLKIRQSDAGKFEVGRNLAVTPGKVIFENELMQLIQYAPATPSVLKTPLLIVPPWINKFYVLDLTPEKSFIKWCVDQGLTVFVISWVNPDERLADKGFEDYMREGPLAALDAIEQATGEKQGPRHRLLRRRHAACRSRSPTWRRRTTTASRRRRCSQRRSISPMPATSRCSSTRSSSRRSKSGWPSAAISKAARWRTPSTCCARTT